MSLLLLGGFVGFMAIGVPLALVIIGSGLVYVLVATDVPMSVVGQRLFVTLDDFTLMAIPLFVLAGYLMNEVGLTERLVEFIRFLLRRVYGALAQVSVLVSMAFGGVSGAAAADLAAVGIPMIPQMEKHGYRREFATATITTSSLMGAVIPPSIPFIIYGVQAETSIGKLFLAGIIPGIGIGIVVMIVNHVMLKRQGFTEPPRSASPPLAGVRLVMATKDALIALLMPVIIIGGILLGVVTPTEAAAVAVLYALVVGFFVFRTLTFAKIVRVLRSSVIMSSVIMLIVAGSGVLNWALAYSLVPQMIAEALLSLTSSAWVFMLIVIVLLLIVGMPLDPVPAIIVVTPILLPAAIGFGIDPVHFGVVVVMVLTIGLATPPVGASLFVAMSVSRVSMSSLSRAIIPFLVAVLAFTVLITFVPAVYNWLPGLG
jgi:C4-dicarboxylate transporter DctM subunit